MVVGIAAVLLATACTVGALPTAARQAMPSGTQDLKAGTYALDFALLDAPGKFPNDVITVPDGWRIYKGSRSRATSTRRAK